MRVDAPDILEASSILIVDDRVLRSVVGSGIGESRFADEDWLQSRFMTKTNTGARSRSALGIGPRIDDADSRVLEVRDISGRDGCARHSRNRGDLRVKL